MIKKLLFKFKYLLLLTFSILTLAACGQSDPGSPEFVMQKAKEAVFDIYSGKIDYNLNAQFDDDVDSGQFEIDHFVEFDYSDEENIKQHEIFDLKIFVDSEYELIDFVVIGEGLEFNGDLYFYLSEFSTNDLEVNDLLQSFVEPYTGKWFYLGEAFSFMVKGYENFYKVLFDDILQVFKESFLKNQLTSVTRDHGIKIVNGRNAHHYELEINEDGLYKFLLQVTKNLSDILESSILAQEFSEKDFDELENFNRRDFDTFFDDVNSFVDYSFELYIDAETYYPLRGIVHVSGEDGFGDYMSFDIQFEGSNFNEPTPIKAPESFEKINVFALIAEFESYMMEMGAGDFLEMEGSLYEY